MYTGVDTKYWASRSPPRPLLHVQAGPGQTQRSRWREKMLSRLGRTANHAGCRSRSVEQNGQWRMAARLPRPDTWTRPQASRQNAKPTGGQGFGPEPILRCTFSHHAITVFQPLSVAPNLFTLFLRVGLARDPFLLIFFSSWLVRSHSWRRPM